MFSFLVFSNRGQDRSSIGSINLVHDRSQSFENFPRPSITDRLQGKTTNFSSISNPIHLDKSRPICSFHSSIRQRRKPFASFSIFAFLNFKLYFILSLGFEAIFLLRFEYSRFHFLIFEVTFFSFFLLDFSEFFNFPPFRTIFNLFEI